MTQTDERQSAILVINSGSSSLKFAVHTFDQGTVPEHMQVLEAAFDGQLSPIGGDAAFTVSNAEGVEVFAVERMVLNHEAALLTLIEWLRDTGQLRELMAIGHRVVHGGQQFDAPCKIDDVILGALEELVPLAPNHQPANILGIEILHGLLPDLPQFACFDTAFHRTRPEIEQRFALPERDDLALIRRYGFHGISYEYIARILAGYEDPRAQSRVIVAHLGQGASLCALKSGQSLATSMTFTPLDGVPMGTRSGALDPAVVLYLLSQGKTGEEIAHLLYFESGLLGVSGYSSDMRELLTSESAQARLAIDMFVLRVVREIGSLAAALGGVDALVFTGGLGEHASIIRERIAEGCEWLGLIWDREANLRGESQMSLSASAVAAWIIPTDEERMIAWHVIEQLYGGVPVPQR